MIVYIVPYGNNLPTLNNANHHDHVSVFTIATKIIFKTILSLFTMAICIEPVLAFMKLKRRP